MKIFKKTAFLFMLSITVIFAESIVKREMEISLTGKPIIYIFDSKTCPYCEKLEKELNEVTFLNDIAKKFDIYAISRDEQKIYKVLGKDVSMQELQMSYRVKATPNIVIFNSKAEKMFQTPGYVDPVSLSKMMEFVLGVENGTYKKSEWAKYLYGNKVTVTDKPKKPTLQQH